jgi:uncharacterized protein YbaA (DUF1428 family)
MKILATLLLVFLAAAAIAQSKDTRYYELRIYYAASGKLDALIKRFSDHTTKIFEKHGMTNVGYWVPTSNDKNTLYYILSYPDKEARAKSWDAFRADPQWTKVKEESEVNGKLVDSVKSRFMYASDILPAINSKSSKANRVFELRTYFCQPGKLPNLITRFKDHTVKIFENHGMQNIVYFVSEEPEGKQPDLIYLLAHKSQEAAKKSWEDFLVDPEWIKARDNSEKDGKILIGLESVYLKPLPFSKLK